MRKIVFFVVLIILFIVNIITYANASSSFYLKYKFLNQPIYTTDGEYIEDVFSKYNSKFYDLKLKHSVMGGYSYKSENISLKTNLELIDSDISDLNLANYYLDFNWRQKVNLTLGKELAPEITKYLLSTDVDSNIEGVITTVRQNEFKFSPLYLRLKDDLENFDQEAAAYGISTSLEKDKLQARGNIIRTEALNSDFEVVNWQQNYTLDLDYEPNDFLELNTNLAYSKEDNSNYKDEVTANLAVYNLNWAVNKYLTTQVGYQQVHELYAPIRSTNFKAGYEFNETDYNQGYKIEMNYRLPKDLMSSLELSYNDFLRTNSYIQAAPYVQENGFADKLADNRIRTYQAGIITESGRFYSRLFYTYEQITNSTDLKLKVDPTESATENKDLLSNYSPGYKDEKISVIHIYSKYRLLTTNKYSLSITGRYVKDRKNNKYHNYNSNFGNQSKENTAILGFIGKYDSKSKLGCNFNYDLEQKKLDFIVNGDKVGYAKGRMHNLGLKGTYKLFKTIQLRLDYNYQVYNLLDYKQTTEGNIYRYYDQDFDNQHYTISLETKFK